MQPCIFRIQNFVVNPKLSRCICSTSTQLNLARESRFLRKMISGTKKKKLLNTGSGSTSRLPSLADEKSIPTHRTRRVDVLNKLFMKHVTDLMATGEVAPQLVGRGIDISHVNVTTDFKFLNIYWYSRFDTSVDELTENVLKKCGGQLQHELSQLRIVGVVPPIKFVQDKRLSILKEIDRRISTIDFGEDFVPTNRVIKKTEPVVFTKLLPKTKSEISELNIINQKEEKNDFDIDLPEMRHDVLGLNCSSIMTKVQTFLRKTQTSTSNQSTSNVSENKFAGNFTVEKFLSNAERRELFTSFLKRQQIKNRQNKKSRSKNIKCLEELDDIDFVSDYVNENPVEDKDFIVEEINLKNCK